MDKILNSEGETLLSAINSYDFAIKRHRFPEKARTQLTLEGVRSVLNQTKMINSATDKLLFIRVLSL